MTQMYEKKLNVKEEEEQKKEKQSTLKQIGLWIVRNLKFILIPGSRIEELTYKKEQYERTISRRKFISRFKSTLTLIGIGIVFFIVTLAVFGPWISPYTFNVANGVFEGSWSPPSPEHVLGTTMFGRDILARLIFGARSSLTLALPSITLSVVAGVIFGIIAGYYGGYIDSIIMRIADVFLAFPGLILAIVLVGILGRKLEFIILAYGILGIPGYSRLIRGSVLQAKELPYIEAAKASGAGNWRIMFKHILPNCIQPIIISFTFDIGGVILSFAGLAFLGYSDPQLIEWGRDIDIGRSHLLTAPWASLFPGIMIIITVLGFMLLGDGLRDALDPRLKNL
ncbi:MAG: ABC transporter permease [Promethearchaeota archaeon]|nr:MAG: ABC transporter permease [Candidatus Lokiarchaeota archaeon]